MGERLTECLNVFAEDQAAMTGGDVRRNLDSVEGEEEKESIRVLDLRRVY